MAVLLLEAELERARARIGDLEDERRVMSKRLERFLRKVAEEKAAWKSRKLKEEVRHRRELEAANAKLLRRLSQQARSYETERRARELMEEACSELTREVEADQAEVELLRCECLRMREEMEEERRMLQMAELWREERVQMKLADARLALDHKYAHLSRLQAEMEAFLRTTRDSASASAAPLREARVLIDAASRSGGGDHRVIDNSNSNDLSHQNYLVDVDSVFEHFRRKEKHLIRRHSPASSASNVSPATDLFLAKVDDGDDPYCGDGSADDEGGRDSCSWVGTTDPSVSVVRASNASCLSRNGSGVTEAAHSSGAISRRSGANKNTALIRRLWTNGWSPSSDRRSTLAAAEQCSSSRDAKAGSPLPRRGGTGTQQRSKQSLKEKLMEARMDDHREKPPSNAVKQKP